MVRIILSEEDGEELAQCQTVTATPGDATVTGDAFEIADETHAEVHPWAAAKDARPVPERRTAVRRSTRPNNQKNADPGLDSASLITHARHHQATQTGNSTIPLNILPTTHRHRHYLLARVSAHPNMTFNLVFQPALMGDIR